MQLRGSESDERTPKKVNEHDEVNVTHLLHPVYEKIEVLYFTILDLLHEVNIFLINFNFSYTR